MPPEIREVKCPVCGSKRVWRDGLRYLTNGEEVQRYICRDCGYRFSDPSKISKRKSSDSSYCRVCGWDCQPKNSAKAVEALRELEKAEKWAAGAADKQKAEIKGKVLEYLFHLHKQGYSEATIRLHRTALKVLTERGANLFDPESVKEVIAKQKWSSARRYNVISAYNSFLKFIGLSWEKPKCKVERKIPFIPTEAEIDALIAGSGRKLSAFLQLLKETAMRAGEAKRLEWTDIDFERRIITLNKPEKGSMPRMWKVSPKLISMLGALPKKSTKVFGDGPINSLKSTFQKTRRKLAHKLQNPRLLKISFHTFRHWKATMLYHQTKDILYVKRFLGHKKLENTEIYVNIEQTLFGESENDEFTVKVASTPEEIKQLLEVGFEYICEKGGLLFFRKRK